MGVTSHRTWTRRRGPGSPPGLADGQSRKLAIEAIGIVMKKEEGVFVVVDDDQIRERNVWEDLVRERISLMMILVKYSPRQQQQLMMIFKHRMDDEQR